MRISEFFAYNKETYTARWEGECDPVRRVDFGHEFVEALGNFENPIVLGEFADAKKVLELTHHHVNGTATSIAADERVA